jgi:hypothetical protein
MASTEGYENPNGRAGSVPMLPKDSSQVDWSTYSMLFFAYLKQKPGAFAVFKLAAPAVDGIDANTQESLNNWCYSMLMQSVRLNDAAMQQAKEVFIPDGTDVWTNTFWKALENRFSKGRIS